MMKRAEIPSGHQSNRRVPKQPARVRGLSKRRLLIQGAPLTEPASHDARTKSMTRVIRISGWLLMTLFAALIALVSLRYFIQRPEVAAGAPLGEKFAAHFPVFLTHVAGGILALLLGPWQFWGGLRNRYLSLHRWLGRIYLAAVLFGGLAGLYLAAIAFGGLPSQFGFSSLDVLWLATASLAYLRVRQGDLDAHREWMIRNYALTFAAVTLRLWIPLLLSTGLAFEVAYPIIAWLSWVPNLLAAEIYISSARRKRASVVSRYAV